MDTTNQRIVTVGNWVNFRHKKLESDSAIGEIVHIAKGSDGGDFVDMYVIRPLDDTPEGQENYTVTNSDIAVLPLTEEYILKIGFMKVNSVTFQLDDWTLTYLGLEYEGQSFIRFTSKNKGFKLNGPNFEESVYEVQVVQNIIKSS